MPDPLPAGGALIADHGIDHPQGAEFLCSDGKVRRITRTPWGYSSWLVDAEDYPDAPKAQPEFDHFPPNK